MSNHTPGPWISQPDDWNPDEIQITSSDHIENSMCEIATISIGYEGQFETEQAANLRVITAAPEMLEALKGIAEKRSDFKTDYDYAQWVVNVAKAVIAKAEGDV